MSPPRGRRRSDQWPVRSAVTRGTCEHVIRASRKRDKTARPVCRSLKCSEHARNLRIYSVVFLLVSCFHCSARTSGSMLLRCFPRVFLKPGKPGQGSPGANQPVLPVPEQAVETEVQILVEYLKNKTLCAPVSSNKSSETKNLQFFSLCSRGVLGRGAQQTHFLHTKT